MDEFVNTLCWLGVLESLLLSGYFLTTVDNSHNRLFLGLILFVSAVRAAKSTAFIFNDPIPLFIVNIGFAAHAATGPLLMLYVRSLERKFVWSHRYWVHFAAATVIFTLSLELSLDAFWYRGGYSVLLFYTLAYVIVCGSDFIRIIKDSGWNDFKGVAVLLVVVTVLLAGYFTNYILKATDYILGPAIYSVLIFGVTFMTIRNNAMFRLSFKRKYQNVKLPEQLSYEYHQRILTALEHSKLYLDAGLSLDALSQKSGVPAYEVSFILNERMKVNFTTLINRYRIAEAQKLLQNPSKNHLSIASIAQDCGFNSLSSFNKAFKTLNNITPSGYRRKQHG